MSKSVEKLTLKNKSYRRVIETHKHLQLVLMTLKPQESIPREIHRTLDQFIRVERGDLSGQIGNKRTFHLKDGDYVIVPAGSYHVFWNSSNKDVHLYTLYSRPNHPKHRWQKRQ